ncbi:NAD-dependent epimerase/dehydratase family protein [Marinobacter zhejiangensis]|uniref:Nucleoside-diphosphate-sugar epimerase n=1 Tax=Marinobacter zhejiangensis TaxID=488535 RepID=A0A1I4QQC6_9GAMM|nr:NAD-dependent epimerase/dehydratase family protein [Marinobacter zhejiangensis]SFM42244.1 Nucleoside-diphosphate-sugar epimerase [Marinobacter zhejiangensis]
MENRASVLVTGATGFVGRNLYKHLMNCCAFKVRGTARSSGSNDPSIFCGMAIKSDSDWTEALKGVDVVVHVAAKAHIELSDSSDQLEEFQEVNVTGTVNLAEQAAQAGVKRFIFISSIGVNGQKSHQPIKASDSVAPSGYYAKSKWEAEQGLVQISKTTGLEIVIIRPPLVYGPGAPGNFGRLVRLVESGLPIPLGAVRNKRTIIGIDNLVSLIEACIDHPSAGNKVFLAGDGDDVSTPELLRLVARAMGKPSRVIPVPLWLLRLALMLIGKRNVADKLTDSLQIDISSTREVLGWSPVVTVNDGLRRCFIDGEVT